jgi:hypothetical protein
VKRIEKPLFFLFTLLLAWAAVCWFSHPFGRPFLGIAELQIDATIPFLLSLISLAGALLIWLISSGRTATTGVKEWLAGNKLFLLGIVGLLALHVLLQIPSIVMYRGANNADSGQYGIAAYHIASGEIRPMYMIGKHHIGSLLHHLTAVLNLAFGKNPAYLRMVTTLFYLGFIILFASLLKKLTNSRTALLAASFAALPPFHVYFSTSYTEFPEILFWGTAALLICAHMIQLERPTAWQYFMLGLVSGLGLWAHPQFLSFLLTVILMLLIRDKLFFIRLQVLAIVPGVSIGGVVILVNSYFYQAPYLDVFSRIGTDFWGAISKAAEDAVNFILYIPTYIGLQTWEMAVWLFHPVIAVVVILLFAVCLAIYVYSVRDELKRAFLLRNFKVGKIIAGLMFLSVFMVFTGSGPLRGVDSTRYIFPVWPAIAAVLAVSLSEIMRKSKIVGYSILVIFLVVFSLSIFSCLAMTVDREGYHRQWVEFCRENGITRFYGPWIRTYWTSFVTGEEIIGANYPFQWEPFIEYQKIVDNSESPLAFMFFPETKNQIQDFEDKLKSLGVGYKKRKLTVGEIIYDLSARITYKQLIALKKGKYSAGLFRWTCSPIKGVRSDGNLALVNVQVRNNGSITWLPAGANGYLELLALDNHSQVIRRGVLAKPVEPGGECSWRLLIERGSSGDEIALDVRVNDVSITNPDGPLKIDLNSGPTVQPFSANDLNPVRLGGEKHDLLEEDFIFLDGWGDRTSNSIWSSGTQSRIGFVIKRPRNLELVMRIQPFMSKSMPRGVQNVGVLLNDTSLGAPFVLDKARNIRIKLPASAQRSGLNLLTFKYSLMEPEIRRYKSQLNFRMRPRAVGIHYLRIRNVRDDNGS